MEEEGLSLQGLYAACQVWRGAMRAGVCLCQQVRQLVDVQPPVVRQVIHSESALSCSTHGSPEADMSMQLSSYGRATQHLWLQLMHQHRPPSVAPAQC